MGMGTGTPTSMPMSTPPPPCRHVASRSASACAQRRHPMCTAPAAAMTTTSPGDTPGAATQLRLMWLASPALPVGGFSYSEGLESAVESGLVTTETQAGDWLLGQLQLSLARCDLPALAQAVAAWQVHDATRLVALNRCV